MTLPAGTRVADAFTANPVALGTTDLAGTFLDANDAMGRLLGYPPAELVGRAVLSFAHPDDNAWDATLVERVTSGEQPVGVRVRRYVRGDGRLVSVRVSASILDGADGKCFAIAMEDVGDFVTVERQNQLLLQVLGILSDAPDFPRAVCQVLERLCRGTSWTMAQLWLPAGDGDVLASSEAWQSALSDYGPLRAASQVRAAVRGEGMVGTAWETQKPAWWSASNPAESHFSRASPALACGVHTAVAIPLVAYGEATGVVEFFSQSDVADLADDGPTADALRVSTHIGSMLSRRRDEQTLRDSEHRLRTITEGAPVAVLTTDAGGRIVGWNSAAETLFGVPRAGAIGRPVTALLTPGARELAAAFLADAHTRADPVVRGVAIDCVRADGRQFPAEVSVTRWVSAGVPFFTAIFRDVSVQHAADVRARQHSDRLAAIVDVQNEVLRAAASVTAVQQLVVERAGALLGGDGAALELREGPDMVYVAAAGTAAGHVGLRLLAATSLSGLTTLSGVPQVCPDTDGDARVDAEACRRVGVRSMLVVPLFDAGESVGALKVINATPREWVDDDVRILQLLAASVGTAMLNARRHEEAVARADKALYDELTGLPRRELLSDRIWHAHRRMRRGGQSTATMFIDLDGFKAINDNFGHAVGDELLVAVAARLTASLRGSDTAARFGGDEFVAFCEDVQPDSVVIVAQRLVTTLSAPYLLSERTVTVTASIGVAVSSDPDDDPDTLIGRADEAMYAAKRSGKAQAAYASGPLPAPRAAIDPGAVGDRGAGGDREAGVAPSAETAQTT